MLIRMSYFYSTTMTGDLERVYLYLYLPRFFRNFLNFLQLKTRDKIYLILFIKVHSRIDLCRLVVPVSWCVIFNCLCVSGTLCGIESVSGLGFPASYQEAELWSFVLEQNARLVSRVSVSVCRCDL